MIGMNIMRRHRAWHAHIPLRAAIFTLIACVMPVTVWADTTEISLGGPSGPVTVDSFIRVPVLLRATDEPGINALDSTLVVSGPARVVAIQTGGSVFSMWPTRDISDGTRIHVVGGTPSSVFGGVLHAYDLVLQITGEGEVVLDPSDTVAYAGDGAGTDRVVSARPIVLKAVAGQPVDEYASYLARDTEAPATFDISLGRDASVFDGKYFLSFFTTDSGTGVERYEVVEGSLSPVVSNGTYVLRDQSLSTGVIVHAYDGAGNVREKTFVPASSRVWRWVMVCIGLLFITAVAAWKGLRLRRSGKMI